MKSDIGLLAGIIVGILCAIGIAFLIAWPVGCFLENRSSPNSDRKPDSEFVLTDKDGYTVKRFKSEGNWVYYVTKDDKTRTDWDTTTVVGRVPVKIHHSVEVNHD